MAKGNKKGGAKGSAKGRANTKRANNREEQNAMNSSSAASSRVSSDMSSGMSAGAGSSRFNASGIASNLKNIRFDRAKEMVQPYANLQTAGIALTAAGVLALSATPGGRRLFRSIGSTVMSFLNTEDSNIASQMEDDTESSDYASV